MKIANSPLFRCIAPYLSESDQQELVRMLGMVKGANLEAATLGGAFDWESTPQGHNYWASICNRLGRAGSTVGDCSISDWYEDEERPQ